MSETRVTDGENVDEYSRNIIEKYCRSHDSAKSRRLSRLVEMSYDLGAVGSDADALWLEKMIDRETDEELRNAMKDLDEELFGW